MSLFRWLFPARKARALADGSRMGSSNPAGRSGGSATASDAASSRKSERMARRELLFAVVRQSMIRAAVLSSGYKFKVLSLDAKGQQFLVMVDLARAHGGDPARLAEIEAMIAQGAKSRHNITVTAVYWRMNEYVAVGDLSGRKQPAGGAQLAEDSQPAVLESHPAALESNPGELGSAAGPHSAARYEPIQADEVAAFKSALAAGVAGPAAVAQAAAAVRPGSAGGASARTFDGTDKHGPQSYTLLTGFEDTELPESPQARRPILSGTQYGDLN